MGKMKFDLHDFYQIIKNENILFCYSGPISHAVIEGIGQTLRMDLEIEDAGQTTSQSLFSIFIEQMQNIFNYSEEKIVQENNLEKELKMGVLVIGYEEENFYIYCGNKIFNQDVSGLQQKIDSIKDLDKAQLKALYKEKRKAETEEGSKGAGLGLIEMARKSNQPIQYAFKNLDETFSFFAIKVWVTRRMQKWKT